MTVVGHAFHVIRTANWNRRNPVVTQQIIDVNGNSTKIEVRKIRSIVPLWPSFWRHPFRHVRMRRAVREYEKMLAKPAARRLRELEDDAFLRGTGS